MIAGMNGPASAALGFTAIGSVLRDFAKVALLASNLEDYGLRTNLVSQRRGSAAVIRNPLDSEAEESCHENERNVAWSAAACCRHGPSHLVRLRPITACRAGARTRGGATGKI